MATRLTGVRFFDLGEEWRKIWISGTPISKIASHTRQNPQTISRAIWLAKIPSDIKQHIRSYPDVFTRAILLDTFAAKRRQCEKDGFALLRSEVQRLIALGAGTKPKLKNTNKSQKKLLSKKSPTDLNKDSNDKDNHLSPLLSAEYLREIEYRIKQALGYACRVDFDKSRGGEVRIFFKNKKSLEGLVETFEPFHKELL